MWGISKQLFTVLLFCLGISGATRAAEWIEFQSTVTGNVFTYRLKVYDNPYVYYTHFNSGAADFTNLLNAAGPIGWTNLCTSNSLNFQADYFDGPAQPYELIFTAQTAATHFRSNNFLTTLAVNINDYAGVGIVGYINFPALIPCSPEEADGSPHTMTFKMPINDVKIDELIRTNQQVYGVRFTFGYDCTLQLEGSHNLNAWTPISRLWGYAGVTTWTTNVSLNPYGKFFRLAYVGQGHLPLSTASRPAAAPDPVTISNFTVAKNSVAADVKTTPGLLYEVLLKDSGNRILKSRRIYANSEVTSVSFARKANDMTLFIEAKRAE